MGKTKEEQRQYSKEYYKKNREAILYHRRNFYDKKFLFKIDKEEFADNSSDSEDEDELNNSIYEGETDASSSEEELDEEISSEEELDEECSSLNESSENKPSGNKIVKLKLKSSTLDRQKDKTNGHFPVKNKVIQKKGTQTNNVTKDSLKKTLLKKEILEKEVVKKETNDDNLCKSLREFRYAKRAHCISPISSNSFDLTNTSDSDDCSDDNTITSTENTSFNQLPLKLRFKIKKSKSDKVRDFIEETSDKECEVIHLENEALSFLGFLYTKHN